MIAVLGRSKRVWREARGNRGEGVVRVLGIILSVVGYIQGINAMFYFGIVPAVGGIWTWSDYGIWLLVGLVGAGVLDAIGKYLRGRAKRTKESKETLSSGKR